MHHRGLNKDISAALFSAIEAPSSTVGISDDDAAEKEEEEGGGGAAGFSTFLGAGAGGGAEALVSEEEEGRGGAGGLNFANRAALFCAKVDPPSIFWGGGVFELSSSFFSDVLEVEGGGGRAFLAGGPTGGAFFPAATTGLGVLEGGGLVGCLRADTAGLEVAGELVLEGGFTDCLRDAEGPALGAFLVVLPPELPPELLLPAPLARSLTAVPDTADCRLLFLM
jgi:hypothetical protein